LSLLAAHYARGETRKNPRRVLDTTSRPGVSHLLSFDNRARAGLLFLRRHSASEMARSDLDPELAFRWRRRNTDRGGS